MKQELILDGLHCANCAAKIENKLNTVEGFDEVRFSFATMELEIEAEQEDIRDPVQKIVDSIEDGVTVVLKEDHPHPHTHHKHGCRDGCCDHDHDHAHGHEHEHHHEGGRVKLILLIIAAALFVAAFVMHLIGGFDLICNILSITSAALAGWDVVIEGVKSVLKRRIDETTLMTVAVIAAMVLGEFVEAAAVMVLFGVGEMLEDHAVEKSRRDIRKLADIRPDAAYLYEDGKSHEVKAEEVAIGTLIEIPPHTRVPLDGVIVEGSTTLDASSLTGESEPMDATVGTELLSGMMNNERSVIIKITKAYADSAATRIVKLVEDSSKNKGNHEKLITRFAMVYTPIMIILAVVIAVVPSLITGDWANWIHKALVCLVASCPCSIVISVPLSYYAGIGAASKSGVLIKGGRYVEALANTKAFALDKTGTLTDNQISVEEIKSTSEFSEEEIIRLAASAESHSAHPIACGLKAYCKDHNISLLELKEHREISGHGVSAQYGDDTITVCKAQHHGISVQQNNEEIGIILLTEHIREEAEEVLRQLKHLGVKHIALLSGDKKISCEKVVKGLSIDKIHGELLPEDKVQTVEKLIGTYGDCCFIGDGINDAPVLSRSTCGIAMGLGSDAAIEAADMVLSNESLSALPRAIRLARKTMRTVKANITFSLLVKAIIILLAIMGIAPLWLAVFSDTGVCLICVLNAVRLIKSR